MSAATRVLNPLELQRLESCIAKATDPLELEAIKKHLLTKQITALKDRYSHEIPPHDKSKPQERLNQLPLHHKRDLNQRISFSESDSGIESPPHSSDNYEFCDIPLNKRQKTQGEASKRRQHLEAERKSRKRVERAYCLLKLLILKPDVLEKEKKAIAYSDDDYKRFESILDGLHQGISNDGHEISGKISLPKHQVYMLAFDELLLLRQHIAECNINTTHMKKQMLKLELENKKMKRQLFQFSTSFNQMKDALGTEQYLTGALIKSLATTPQLPILNSDPLSSRTNQLQQTPNNSTDSINMLQLLGLMNPAANTSTMNPAEPSISSNILINSPISSDNLSSVQLSCIDLTQTHAVTTNQPIPSHMTSSTTNQPIPSEDPPPYPSVSLTELSMNNCTTSSMTVHTENTPSTSTATLVPNNSQLTAKKANMLCLALVGLLFLNPLDVLSQILKSKTVQSVHTSRTLLSSHIQDDFVPSYIYQSYVRPVLFILLFTILSLNNSHRCRPGSHEETIIMEMIKTPTPAKGQRKSEILHALRCLGTRPATSSIYMMVNILWKVFFHLLYQLGILPRLKRVQAMLLYKNAEEEQEENYSYGLIARLHSSLHESSMKECEHNVLETTYYIWSAICAAEVSGNRELMCQMYMTGALHMKKQSFAFSSFLLYYFTTLGRHNAYDESGTPLPSVEWMFESNAFEYISSGRWYLKSVHMMQTIKKDNLLYIVRQWFKRDLIIDTIEQLVIKGSSSDMKLGNEARLMLLVLLRNSDSKWQKEGQMQIKEGRIHDVDTFCGFWGCLLTQIELVRRSGSIDVPALQQIDQYYNQLPQSCSMNSVARDAFIVYILVKMYNIDPNKSIQLNESVIAIPLINNLLVDASIKFHLFINEQDHDEAMDRQLVQACSLLICQLLLDASVSVLDHGVKMDSHQLYHYHSHLQYLQQHAQKYPQVNKQVADYCLALQKHSNMNPLHRISNIKKFHLTGADDNTHSDVVGQRTSTNGVGSWLPAELLFVLSLIPMTLLYSRFAHNLFQTL